MFRKLVSCFVSLCAVAAAESSAGDYRDVFALLDLDRPGLEKVKADCGRGQWRKASADLLEYYRTRQGVYIPGQESRQATAKDSLWADDALEHTFHVLDKPVWNYGRNIDWTYWPEKEIEMRVQLHRQGWWQSLARMWCTTGDEKYAREYAYEFRDWVKKNPYRPFIIDQRGTVSSGAIAIDAPNECFAWRPLEIGIRLLRWPVHFSLTLSSRSFTPEFLMEFLRSYHQNASLLMGMFSPAGNHLIHQSQGMIRAGVSFPEFKDAETWVKAGADNLNREISRQSYPDGCHFELDPGYHQGFIESYDSAIQTVKLNGRMDLFPADCLEKLVRMTAYYLDYCYPDLGHPCFSDARRGSDEMTSELLRNVAAYCDSPYSGQVLWFAGEGKEGTPPSYKSSGHPDTGFYTFRDGWFDADIIMPVKATERGMWHAQPDFGTFELWAYGRKLMPDAGAYTYSGDEEIERQRAYFKATARHNAVTLDDRNYDDPVPEVVRWTSDGRVQLLTVRHNAYDGLSRRRTVAFVDEKYFVVVDEIDGPATGRLTLRNCLGEGYLTENVPASCCTVSGTETAGDWTYRDGNAGMRIVVAGPEGSTAAIDRDWYSEAFHEKKERPVIRLDVQRKAGDGVQRFVTVIYPFDGDNGPDDRTMENIEISKIIAL